MADPINQLGETSYGNGSAYILPQSQQNPIGEELNYIQQQKIAKAKQQAALAQLGITPTGVWSKDIPEISKQRQDFVNTISDWNRRGVKYQDPRTPEWKQFQGMVQNLYDLPQASMQHKKYYDAALQHLQQNPDKYDQEGSNANILNYASSPSIMERDRINPNLLVDKGFDPNDWFSKYHKANPADELPLSPINKGGFVIQRTNSKYNPEEVQAQAAALLNDSQAKKYLLDRYNSLPADQQKKTSPEQLALDLANEYNRDKIKEQYHVIPKYVFNNAFGGGDEDADAEDIINRTQRVLNGEGYEDYGVDKDGKLVAPSTGNSTVSSPSSWMSGSKRISTDLNGLPIGEKSDALGHKSLQYINYIEEKDGKYFIHTDDGEVKEVYNKSGLQNILRPYMKQSGRGVKYNNSISKVLKKRNIIRSDGTEHWERGGGQSQNTGSMTSIKGNW